ncbi:4-hydroxy 2-oxovalerate aldolase [Anaerosporobacter mobilis DSM 15930]|uniref:4-hydroxy 2-oxovalerate aldolase n=1 Tax=Anaerosporobacter mobilis DSM 15930 TaxID=1120996 RepID=A0A1M7LNF5_9FIRM|nr:4-hydroxy-2-oxovalerate aldolase [Anaerosporobacter mobilis]SHM79681.1 4-hydroxy 2-oxovalerate aldolase [Anaerosporobacter mobilis DSM 15930]
MKKINIMDVTLRDGSYAINFQFSCADVMMIGGALDKLGYNYIEIGHGMGLGASSPKNGQSLNSDEEYLKSAQRSIKNAKYGVFCIPGVASYGDIEKAASLGMKFIRIGTNVDEIKKSEPYIKIAKSYGLEVMANYMKSYALAPEKFAEQVAISQSYGADVVYIVDSAGGMLPYEIENYYNAIRKVSDIRLGFHAHNNLGLALSNSIFAASIGIEMIDCSLQGLGRSAGNASTELFTICMQKYGYDLDIDYKKLLMVSNKLVRPFVKKTGIDPIDTICGVTSFHTSYLHTIHKQSAIMGCNPLELIEEYSKIDKIGMDTEKLATISKALQVDYNSLYNLNFTNYFGNEQL